MGHSRDMGTLLDVGRTSSRGSAWIRSGVFGSGRKSGVLDRRCIPPIARCKQGCASPRICKTLVNPDARSADTARLLSL